MGILYDLFGIPTQAMVECEGHQFQPVKTYFVEAGFVSGFCTNFVCRNCRMYKRIETSWCNPIKYHERIAILCKRNPTLRGNINDQLYDIFTEMDGVDPNGSN